MADERREGSRPSWRRRVSEPPPKPGKKSDHEWSKRRLKSVAEQKPPSTGTLRTIAVTLGLMACLAAVIVLIYMILPPPSVAVVLVGSDYADNLMVPSNVLGWRGLEALNTAVRAPHSRSLLPTSKFVPFDSGIRRLEQRDDWDRLIQDLKKKGFAEETIILVVALHGGSDSKGAYLYPGKLARFDDQIDERLNLRDVIRSLKELPEKKQKILILEAAQVPSNWQLGMLHNDFSRRLAGLEKEIANVPGLWVLSAADVDQQCWASEGLGRTIFFHYLIEALGGEAVGKGGRLNLHDVHQYVSKKVRDWVWNTRGAIQEPVLLPRSEPRKDDQRIRESADSPAGPAIQTAARTPSTKLDIPTLAKVPPLSAEDSPLQELRGIWRDHDELDVQVPHPSIYSPRRWREYQTELVRISEVLRGGGTGLSILSVRDRATARFRRERFLRFPLSSGENNLAMSALEGPASQGDSAQEFIPFWKTESLSEATTIWKDLVGAEAGSEPGRPSIRLRGVDYLLKQAIQEPGPAFEPAAEKLEITRGQGRFLPAEAHFVRMLAKRLKPVGQQPPKLLAALSRAVLLRKQAERTALGVDPREGSYSYSEQVAPWIAKPIQVADEQRRLGEDRLFASDEAAWDQAVEHLRRASDLYSQVAGRAAIIRAALETRDQTLANLPELSLWAASRRQDHEKFQGELLSQIEDLWERTHRLAELLELRPAKPEDVDKNLPRLRDLGGEVSEGLKRISGRFSELAVRTEEERPKDEWQEAAAAAAVPGGVAVGASIRELLWERLDELRRPDREAVLKKSDTTKLTNDDVNQIDRNLRLRIEAQGRMALAVLGDRWFNDESFPIQEQGSRAATLQQVLTVRDASADSEQSWWNEVAVAGERIGARWRRLAGQIDQLQDEQSGIADFSVFRDQRLVRADRLERQVEAGAARLPELGPQASIRLREARIHDLLLGMARRSWDDHWFDEDGKERYYNKAGMVFLRDAEKFFPETPPLKEARTVMARAGRITAQVQHEITLTSEAIARIPYDLIDEGSVPSGVPVVRAVVERLLELEEQEAGFHTAPRDRAEGATALTLRNPLASRFEVDPALDRPDVKQASVRLEGFFRGQEFDGTTAATLHPVPDTVAIGPPPRVPPDAHIAVRASKEIIDRFGVGTGSIAIVLDCSDSMLATTESGRTKFKEAQQALRDVLALVPPKTRLSLWTFSQMPEGVQEVYKGDPLEHEPELTIKPLLKMAPWDPNRTDEIVRQVAQLRPRLTTPLATAMYMAAVRDLKDAKGFKTLLVLTDGDDTELKESKPKYNPHGLSVTNFILAGFKDLGIAVNMVFFTPRGKPDEIKNARDNFGPALDQLDPKGSFKTAKDLGELVLSLTQGLTQKLTCQILRPDGTPVDDEPINVTDPREEEDWSRGLKPGSYKLRINAGRTLEQDVDLREGDRLIIELVEASDGTVHLRRGLYGDINEFAGRIRQGVAWRTTVLANQIRNLGGQNQLQIATALEKRPEEGRRLRQVYPAFVWHQLGADLVDQPERLFMTRWRERIFFPGPVWHLDVPRWIPDPAGGGPIATPILKTWWNEPENSLEHAENVRFPAPGQVSPLPPPIRLGEGNVVKIESIDREEHTVEVEPGKTKLEPCLVIRLSFVEGHRCLVDPASLIGQPQVVGHEHRIYSQARTYTGLFWPVNLSEFRRLGGFSLVDLDRMLERAEAKNQTHQIKLGPPAVGVPIPGPPEVPQKPG